MTHGRPPAAARRRRPARPPRPSPARTSGTGTAAAVASRASLPRIEHGRREGGRRQERLLNGSKHTGWGRDTPRMLQPRVMVAEDDAELRELLVKGLRRH